MMIMASSIEIKPSDVIRIIEQYLKENNLLKTLQCLQEETSVSLNTADVEKFVEKINAGEWDEVLRVVKLLKLPDSKLMDLYELIVIELIEMQDLAPAKWIMNKTAPMLKLKTTAPDRFLNLQNLLRHNIFDYGAKERRRKAIARELEKEVTVLPSQRLLALIGAGLKHEGILPANTSIDIFTGKAHMSPAEEEAPPNILHKHCIKPLKNITHEALIFVTCAEFSPDGHYIVVGYSTGLVEVRDSTTGKISNDLKYQLRDQSNYIVTPNKSAALSLCFSTTGEYLAIGDKSGDISVWRLVTGEFILWLKKAHHDKAVRCLSFHRDGKKILSGGNDNVVELHSIPSNRVIRHFKGHTEFVNAVAFSKDDNFILTGGSDQKVKIWNVSTGHLMATYNCTSKVHTILNMPQFKRDIFLIGTNSIQLIDLEGKKKDEWVCNDSNDLAEEETNSDEEEKKPVSIKFEAVCLSPKGNWIYAVDHENIYCFDYSTKKIVLKKRIPTNDRYLVGVKHHPFLNLLATFDSQNNLKLWKQ